MRLFIAAELPENLMEALAETSADLRGSVKGRYVGPNLLHVTLAFLGEVEAARVPQIEAALEEACAGHVPFPVTLGELGYFGRRSDAVLWQGFDAEGAKAFAGLARDVREALAARGFTFDGKKFSPHVTLMRSADVSRGVLPMPCIATGTVDTVTLFKSDLSGKHPVYTPLAGVTLE
ncbi:MAG: RNA 2',3'-cyclic phosphodiesterase [Eggerthellaceae bacterium]|nr:RNA 2',3'-cyclic phosphodiesterase [Eggerthellaceae bacterium]